MAWEPPAEAFIQEAPAPTPVATQAPDAYDTVVQNIIQGFGSKVIPTSGEVTPPSAVQKMGYNTQTKAAPDYEADKQKSLGTTETDTWKPPEAAFKSQEATPTTEWQPPADAFEKTSGTPQGTGWRHVTGSEFGEVDNPAHGGYTEPNWNKGAGGANLAGWDTEGVSFKQSLHIPVGTRVEVFNPNTGQSTITTVKDVGPGESQPASIDLLAGTRAALGLPKNSEYPVSYRVLGPGGTREGNPSGGWEPPAAAFQAAEPPKEASGGEGYLADLPPPKAQTALPVGADQESYSASAAAQPFGAEVRPGLSVESGYAGPSQAPKPRSWGDQLFDATAKNDVLDKGADVLGLKTGVNMLQNLWSSGGQAFGQVRLGQQEKLLGDARAGVIQPPAGQDREAWLATLEQDIANTKERIAGSEAGAPGQDFKNSIPGTVSSFVGENLPFLGAAVSGPEFAPAVIGTQMAQSSYGTEYDKAYSAAKQAHPEYSQDQLQALAHKAGTDAANVGFESGIVMSFLHVPKLGGPVTSMISRLGMRGTYMMLAGSAQDIADNIATKKYADPSQNIYEGVQSHLAKNFGAGVAFELLPALGEATTGAEAKPAIQTPPEAKTTPTAIPDAATAEFWTNPQFGLKPIPEKPVTAKEVLGPEVSDQPDTRDFIKTEVQRIYPDLTPQEHAEIANRMYLTQVESTDTIRQRNQLESGVTGTGAEARTPKELEAAQRAYDEEKGQAATLHPDLKAPIFINDVRINRGLPDEALRSTGVSAAIDQLKGNGNQSVAQRSRAGLGAPELPEVKGQPTASQMSPAEPKVNDTEPWLSTMANRFTEERSAKGEIGEIAPGKGYATTDLIRIGEKMKPEEVTQHISDLMRNETGNPKLQAGAVRVEEARLSELSQRMSLIAEDHPSDRQAAINAENAFKDLTDFHNGPVRKLKNDWHAQGMTMQGEHPVDLGTFNGLREAWLKDNKENPPPAQVLATMKSTAKRVRKAVDTERAAMKDLGDAIEKAPRTKKGPTADEVRARIMERFKDDPCRTL